MSMMNRYFGLHTLEGEWHAVLPRYLLVAERVAGKRVLDLGCGSGIGASLLLERGAARVDAVDPRPEVVDLASIKHAKQGLHFALMALDALGFEDATFDMVVCLDHTAPVTDPALLAEVRRVLRPGGEYACALERRKIRGLDSLLPNYSYRDPVRPGSTGASATRQVPQMGALLEFFPSARRLVQRPHYAFVFEAPMDETPWQAGGQGMPSSEDSGQLAATVSEHESEGAAAPVAESPAVLDASLCASDVGTGAVEILFCSAEPQGGLPRREVVLPYFALVERLKMVVFDQQERAAHDSALAGGGEPGASAEATANPFAERVITSEYKPLSDWEEVPTQSRHGAEESSPLAGMQEQVQLLHERLEDMTSRYAQVREELAWMFEETRRMIAGRDEYIEVLRAAVEQFEGHRMASGGHGGAEDSGEKTGVFRALQGPASEAEAPQSDPVVDAPAGEEQARPEADAEQAEANAPNAAQTCEETV